MDATTKAVVIFIALVLSGGFLAIVIVLVPALRELKNLLVSLQKTSDEARAVAEDVKKISSGVEGKIASLGGIVSNAQKITSSLGAVIKTSRSPAFKYVELLALLPAILLGWKVVSNARRKKNERQQ